MAKAKDKKKTKKKVLKNVPVGRAHVVATFNNTIITITDLLGNTISWSSAGRMGFSGARKSTAYAAQLVAEQAGKRAMENGMQDVEVHLSGPGAGRESAVRSFQSIGMNVTLIRDVTPIPHNGCRPKKKRRV